MAPQKLRSQTVPLRDDAARRPTAWRAQGGWVEPMWLALRPTQAPPLELVGAERAAAAGLPALLLPRLGHPDRRGGWVSPPGGGGELLDDATSADDRLQAQLRTERRWCGVIQAGHRVWVRVLRGSQTAPLGLLGSAAQAPHALETASQRRGADSVERALMDWVEAAESWRGSVQRAMVRASRSAWARVVGAHPGAPHAGPMAEPAAGTALREVLELWSVLLASGRGLLPHGARADAPSLRLAGATLRAALPVWPGVPAATAGPARPPGSPRPWPRWSDELLVAAADDLLGATSPLRAQELGGASAEELELHLDPLLLGACYEELADTSPSTHEVREVRKHAGATASPARLAPARGRFYTPPSLLRLGARRAIGQRAADHSAAEVAKLRVLDPAMGCGGFLCEALDVLHEQVVWRRERSELRVDAPSDQEGATSSSAGLRVDLARRCLFGVDSDPAATRIARLVVWLRVGVPQTLPLPLTPGLRWGDALTGGPPPGQVDTPPVEGGAPADRGAAAAAEARDTEQAPGICWASAFPAVWADGAGGAPGFDVIVGNPPYVGESGNRGALRRARSSWVAPRAPGKTDLWHFFALLAGRLLAPDGVHLFVVPPYWRTATGATAVRRLLLGELTLVDFMDLGGQRVFARAPGQHTCVYLARRRARPAGAPKASAPPPPTWTRIGPGLAGGSFAGLHRAVVAGGALDEGELLRVVRVGSDDLRLVPERLSALRARMEAGALRLDGSLLRQGIVANPARLRDGGIERGVFVLTRAEALRLGSLTAEERDCVVPFLSPGEVPALGPLPEPALVLLYLAAGGCPDPAQLPTLVRHLRPFEDRLRARREVKTEHIAWYHLHWPREREIFEQPGLLLPRQCTTPRCCYSPGGLFVDLGCNVIRAAELRERTGWDARALAALLCSAVVRLWLAAFGKRKGRIFQLDQGPLRELPIPAAAPALQAQLRDLAETAVSGARTAEWEEPVDRVAAEAYGVGLEQVYELLGWLEDSPA